MQSSTLTSLPHPARNRFAVLDGRAPASPAREAAPPAIAVLIAHGEALVRAGLRALLEQQRDIRVTGEAADGEHAVALAARHRPDLVLMDAQLPGVDCLHATRRILATPQPHATSVLMLSPTDGDHELFAALRAGAHGFVIADTDPLELLRAVRVVAGGRALLSPRRTRRLIDEFAAQPHPGHPVPEQFQELTAREREVMALAAIGLTNTQIAQRLTVSPATAKTHVGRAMMKLHAHDRAKLVALAYQGGLVEPRHAIAPAGPGPSSARAAAAERVGVRW
jgi:DNA-binding NarL/FixJ family response regulator